MKRVFLVVIAGFVLLGFLATGCTLGLTPEQAEAMNEFIAKREAKKSEYQDLQRELVALAQQISSTEEGSPLWKKLWERRDEVFTKSLQVAGELKAIEGDIRDLKEKGVPGWSIALNVLQWGIATFFGVGGVGAGLIGMVKNAKAKRMLQATVNGVEAINNRNVKRAIADEAARLGVDKSLHAVVKSLT